MKTSKQLKAELITILSAELAQNLADYEEYKAIRAMLLPYVGKQLTKKIKLVDGYTFLYGFNGPEIQAPSGNKHFVCYSSEAFDFKIERFDECNAPYNRGAKERAEKIAGILKRPEDNLNAYVNLYKAYEVLKSAVEVNKINDNYINPASYSIEKHLELPFDMLSGVKYGFKR